MTADDVIDAYVTDVAVQLPRRQRNDVAFELRALLREELQAKAAASGGSADAALATDLMQAFGRPVDVAARYRPTLTIVDPADGRSFLRATVLGLAVIWCAGLFTLFGRPIDSGWDLLGVLGQWMSSTVIPSLWWPGVLIVGFAGSAWARRRWPPTAQWQPRIEGRIHGGRATLVLGLVGILCGLFVLTDPRWPLDLVFGGRAAPAAYEALTYTETFLHRQAPWLLLLLVLNIPMLIVVIGSGRWSATMRRFDLGLSLATCAAIIWTVLDGPILLARSSDQTAKALMILIVAFVLVQLAIKLRKSVRPAPG